VTGKLQSEQGVIHIVAERMNDLTPMLGLLSEAGPTIGALARADEAHRTEPTETRKRQGNRFAGPPRLDDPRTPPSPPIETMDIAEAMPAGRNFR
jgi:error-prone DNA polymerase